MDDRCDNIPWFQTPPVSRALPPEAPYVPGDLVCDVLTGEGQRCGNRVGIGRCRDYCARRSEDWQAQLLPIAMRMLRNEVASVFSPEHDAWVPASTRFSNVSAWNQEAQQVGVELMGYRRGTLIYHGTIMVTPAQRDGIDVVEIGTEDLTDSLALIRDELFKLTPAQCLMDATGSSSISIRAPHKQDLTVGNAVSLGIRILLVDAIAQLQQPFSMVCRYSLPGVRSDAPFETDANTIPRTTACALGAFSIISK